VCCSVLQCVADEEDTEWFRQNGAAAAMMGICCSVCCSVLLLCILIY